MKKSSFSSQSPVYSQVLAQLQTIDNFKVANAAAKALMHKPDWDCIVGTNALAGFLGCSRALVRSLIKSEQIPAYKLNGAYYFLIYEVLREINMDEQLFRINWNSYEDAQSSPDEPDKIHWKKFLYTDRVLVKYTYFSWTDTLSLPITMWSENSKIIKRMIKAINKRASEHPF